MSQIQGPNSRLVDSTSTHLTNEAPSPLPDVSNATLEGLIDPHLWPVDALERVLAAIGSTR